MKKLYLFLLLFCFAVLHAQPLEGLLLNYDFNGNVDDVSNSSYNGIPFGITYAPDQYGNPNSAAYFNGIDSYVNFPNVSELKTGFPVSFSFWVRYESSNYQQQVILNTSFENNRSTGVWFNSTNSTNQYALNFGDGSYSYTPYTRSTFVSNYAIQPTEWHHVVAIVNSATDMKIYIDKLESVGYYSGEGGSLVYSITPGCLGRHDRDLSAPADYFHGYLDNFFYWNKALTSAEVEDMYYLDAAEFAKPTALTVYPNPVDGELSLKTGLADVNLISIYNSVGQQVFSSAFIDKVDVSSYAPGLYILIVKSNDASLTQKVIIK